MENPDERGWAGANDRERENRILVFYLVISNIQRIFAAEFKIFIVMGTILGRTKTKIKTSEGTILFRRVTTVRMPNGKLRFPVDYYDATPGTVEVSDKELESLRNPVYKQLL